MWCQWEELESRNAIGKRRVRCTICGLTTNPTVHPLDRIVAKCRGPRPVGEPRPLKPKSPPTTARKLLNFSLAAIQHVAAGMPTCNQDEIDQRIAVCHTCELYQPNQENPEVGVCGHPDCGCTVTREAKFISKLAWRDQKCPLGKWPELEGGS